jgi:amidohydrolase
MTSALDSIVAHATALRRELHQQPELTWEEHATAARVRAELDRLGLPWRACAGTGTIVDLGPAAGARTAFRADLDALPLTECSGVAWSSRRPGAMHACGHDGHTASLLAAAAWFKAHEASLPRPLRLLWQPAEEGGHGAKRMCDEGALDGVAEIYGYHNWPPIPLGRAACPAGPLMAANGEWTAVIRGRGGHVAEPHRCIDPVLAGAHFVTSVQQVVTKACAPQEAAVVGVTCFHGGTADNIIPDQVELVGTVRAATTALRERLVGRVEACLQAACAPSGAGAEFRWEPCYPATVNHPAPAGRAQAALARVLGGDWAWDGPLPLMAAEDFSYYQERIPGAYLLLGSGRPSGDTPGCHSPRFDFEDRLIATAVRLWSDLAGLPADDHG